MALGLQLLLPMPTKEVKRKVHKAKVVKEKARVKVRAKARVVLKLQQQPLRKTKWTSLVMILRLTLLLLKQ